MRNNRTCNNTIDKPEWQLKVALSACDDNIVEVCVLLKALFNVGVQESDAQEVRRIVAHSFNHEQVTNAISNQDNVVYMGVNCELEQ